MANPRVFTRAEWGARPPRCATPRPDSAIRTVYAHYSDTHESIPSPTHAHDVEVVRGIQRYHMDARGYCDIAYAILIGGNGDIYLGRPNRVVQAAVFGHNHDEWSVCFLTDGPITDAQWHSFLACMFMAVVTFPNVAHFPAPHSAVVQTACPGPIIRARLATIR